MDLQKEWFDLLATYNCEESIKLDIFDQVHKKYSNKKRAYHNTKHIIALLKIADNFSQKIQNIDVIKFAIWFHDVIYQPWRKDNEEKSAKFAIDAMLKLGAANEKIEKVSQLILLTKSHTSFTNDFDENIFLDSDLSILGVNETEYLKYTENIRREYSFVPELLYKKGRISVLNHFLNMDKIYKTSEMQEQLEDIARNNLKKELDFLSN